jgi:hypothetical protein
VVRGFTGHFVSAVVDAKEADFVHDLVIRTAVEHVGVAVFLAVLPQIDFAGVLCRDRLAISGKYILSKISRELDGNFNEDYCKWCYTEGKFTYSNKDTLLDFLLSHMPNPENTPDAERRKFFDSHLSQLKHWKA